MALMVYLMKTQHSKQWKIPFSFILKENVGSYDRARLGFVASTNYAFVPLKTDNSSASSFKCDGSSIPKCAMHLKQWLEKNCNVPC